MPRPFRFGVNLMDQADGSSWRAKCRRAEELGYDVILVPDHLGMPAPFPALVAAAEVTERPRLGTFVLNTGFWNPTLLAREIAGTDALAGGRLEIGLGAGYVREEHERAGLEFPSPGARVRHLRRTVEELDRLLGDEEHLPRTVQRPRPPLLIGGNGDRVLDLAAERAETVAFSGGRETKEGIKAHTADALEERVAAFRARAARHGTDPELNLLLQLVAVTDDRAAEAGALGPLAPDLTEDELLALPILALGTVPEICGQLRARRERFGFSYFTVLEPHLEAFAPVVRELSGE
ncbi:TIGR03621 family F420-dependent LLM class oxidoreductase [Streptomyces triticagri]|uniref:TIGR03621 family F420-dependent LLM class oxidoreductase n=1 Tax=Streptomyces triticagri TaxID=2293568 RepID=A0A372M4D2_9ACTN|nr:TIGR03621 family F420-dependent LLM class oxidoreductase [Streptomyces triticagri]RFU85659.1 TIGR03621 family F420-dependent LLM class oxidoreductase [Streptomyces triticagri]